MNSKNIKSAEDTSILIVDDDRITRTTLTKVLEKAGYHISAVESGEKAIEYCIDQLPDLVLLDVMMPGLDGYDTCKALRTIADYNLLPILILTGLDDIKSIDKAFQAGSTDFITKPFNWPLLLQRVRYALRTRELFEELNRSRQKLTKAHTIARIGYWELDISTNVITLFDETRYLLGLPNSSFTLNNMLLYLSEADAERLKKCISNTLTSHTPYTLDHSFITDHGVTLTLTQQGEYTERQGTQMIVGTLQDITERKKAEDLIYFHRYYDPETSLPNRDYLQLQIDHLIENTKEDNLYAIVNLSFDKLRSIGSTIGHDAVNQFLKLSAERIQSHVANIFEVSRISTTTLGFIIHNMQSIDQIEQLCQLLIRLFQEPVTIHENEYHTTLSIGITTYPLDADTGRLINNSITAQRICYQQGGSRYIFYTKKMNDQTQEQIVLEKEMRLALDNNEFFAFFQPQINSVNNQLTGMEALSRWIRPDGTIIPPDKFIPLAEETEIILELGKEILSQSCRFAKYLQQQNLGNIRVGVNLSAMQFTDENLIHIIRDTLSEFELDPELLEIEITESIAMFDIAYAVDILSKIRDMGIKTSMDDFGTGYSSLSYLQKLPLDTLKIDQSFIRPIGPAGENSEIARAIIAMGHSLNMHLIAEGAEQSYHYTLLKELGCHEIQGFYFSKPLCKDDFIQYITNNTIQQKLSII